MRVVRMKNKTMASIPVELAGGPTVMLGGGAIMENVDVANWAQVGPYVEATVEMQEVRPKGKTYLRG